MKYFRQFIEAMQDNLLYLLILVIFVQSIYPITSHNSAAAQILYQLLYISLIVAGVLVSRSHPRLVAILIALGMTWGVAGIIYTANQESFIAQMVGYVVIIAFQSTVAWVLLRYIFLTPKVRNRNVIYAATIVYILVGAIFVPIYGMIESMTFATTGVNAFSDSTILTGSVIPWQTFIYYSYATLTTLGYGDVLPVSMWARSAASLEAIIGVLYITIIMARLIGLYASQEVEEEVARRTHQPPSND